LGRAVGIGVTCGSVRPPALPRHQVLQSVAVDVHAVQGMRLRYQLGEQVLLEELRVAVLGRLLLVPPDAVGVRGTADDVRLAVAVDVVGEHAGPALPAYLQARWMKRPGPDRVTALGGLFPPARRADHVLPAIAIDVAHAQTVPELAGPRDLLARDGAVLLNG